jgi:cytochrome bd ubiquinol oxidase subunit II
MDLPTLWFVLIAVLWGGYFLLEGFDFGVGVLLPFLPRDEDERSEMFDSIGPVWDGNEVWLVVAGGATFAAFPAWYATMFSGFYEALLLVLVCLIVRVLSFEWRKKSDDPRWRSRWTWANTIGSIGAAFVWGVALSNLVKGVPLNSAGDYAGNFWDLFSPYTVFAGVITVLLFAWHGATYLSLRTRGDLLARAGNAARKLAPVATIGVVLLLAWTVAVAVDNNAREILGPAVPAVLGGVALILALVFGRAHRGGWAFLMTALGTVLLIATIFTSLYPRVMVSSPEFANSLTVAGASASHYSLKVMTIVAVILIPIILIYQSWTYYVFRERVGGRRPAASPVEALSPKPDEAPGE